MEASNQASFLSDNNDLESQNASEFEIEKTKLKNEMDERLAAFLEENELKRQLDQEEYDTNAEMIAQRKELENELALVEDENEKLRLKNKLDSLSLITQDYELKNKKLHQETEFAKWEATASLFGGVAQLLGENTKAGKAAAIAQVQMSTGIAIARVWEAKDTLPAPFNTILKIAQTAIAVGNMIGAMNRVTKAQAARGMMIEGPSHANGGVPIMTPNGMIEAEGGEVIINKRSSALYRDELSAINQAGGGVKFANGGVIGSNLATVQNSFKVNSPNITLDDNAVSQISGAIYSGSQEGFENLSENRKIANGVIY